MPDTERVREDVNIDEMTRWRPRADIFETSHNTMRVEFELPGVPKQDIHLSLDGDVLVLRALKPQTRKEEQGLYFQSERHYGRFLRRLVLPRPANPSGVKATLENGVLKVELTPGEGGRVEIVDISSRPPPAALAPSVRAT